MLQMASFPSLRQNHIQLHEHTIFILSNRTSVLETAKNKSEKYFPMINNILSITNHLLD